MQLNTLSRKTANKTKKRVGRGGKRGKTSGKGHKGQKARSGHRIRPESRDIIKKIPKRRGYGKHRADSAVADRVRPVVINLEKIEKRFEAGETVSVKTLLEKGLIRTRGGKMPEVKILGRGTLSKKLSFDGVLFSSAVREKLGK